MPPVLRLNQCDLKIQRRCVKRGLRAIGPASCTTYIPDMSCDDPKRARHRQRQAAYEARQRDRLPLSTHTSLYERGLINVRVDPPLRSLNRRRSRPDRTTGPPRRHRGAA